MRLATFALLTLAVLVGCSSVATRPAGVPLSTVQQNQRYLLIAHVDNPSDSFTKYTWEEFDDTRLYRIVYEQFADALPIGDMEPYSGVMDVTFSWHHFFYFSWVSAKMLIVVKKNDGEQIWSADYNYKGGWETSGYEVNSPGQAALLVTKRLKEKFLSDFGVKRSH
jgi:uncharacterized protein YceK